MGKEMTLEITQDIIFIYKYQPLMIFLLFWFQLSLSQQLNCQCAKGDWKRQPRLHLNLEEFLAPTCYGFSLIVCPSDSVVSGSILDTGTWQPQLIKLIAQIVQPGDIIVNLGAHVGLEAILMGKKVGIDRQKKGRVYAFEPMSSSYRMLVKNVYINQLQDIIFCYRVALGARAQSLILQVDEQNTGHSHIYYGNQKTLVRSQSVHVQRLDSLLSFLQYINFALIDIESYEVPALLGMRLLLERSPQLVAIIEWRYQQNPYKDQQQALDLLEIVAKLGFAWVRYVDGHPCQIGTFLKIKDYKQLLTSQEEDLLLVGPQAPFWNQFQVHL